MKILKSKPIKPNFPESKIEVWNRGLNIKGLLLIILAALPIIIVGYLISKSK